MNEDVLSKLHDIKELEKIPDYSIFIFSILIFLGIILVLTSIFLFIKYFLYFSCTTKNKYIHL